MLQQFHYSNQLTFFQKLRSFDFTLMFCILIIGIISLFALYYTAGGDALYRNKNHVLRQNNR